METSDVISLGSAIVALLSFAGALAIFAISKRRENYQNLLERILFYSSPEMLMAIQRLWNLYREQGENDFADKYIEIIKAENQQVNSMPANERLEFLKSTLHYQRRLVYTFWSGLGILLKSNLLSRKIAFVWWSQDDVEIVEKILIPLQNKIAEYFQSGRLNPKTDPLYYIANLKNKFYILLSHKLTSST